METIEMFNVLEITESTNNYAMAKVHAGMAKHGMAWFAREQTQGKGQQGKTWESRAGLNIAISIALQPGKVFQPKHFLFNAAIAIASFNFFKSYAGAEVFIKWPNDIYWRDRKAGGILIENKMMGNSWNWSVVGIGMNINQDSFSKGLSNPVSLAQITGRNFDPLELAKKLHQSIMHSFNSIKESDLETILQNYNDNLYLKGKTARLKKGNIVFDSKIKSVNEFGQLLTEDAVERVFNFGEVSFVV